MADIGGITLGMAIQAVQLQIRTLEGLLTSETLRDPADIQDLIFTYERAAEELKAAYLSEWTEDCNLPPYEELIDENVGPAPADVVTFPKGQ